MKNKKNNKQPRNHHAISAHFRNSAGVMKDKKESMSARDIFKEMIEGVQEMSLRQNKTNFDDFMDDIEEEAKKEGPEAVEELKAFSEYFSKKEK